MGVHAMCSTIQAMEMIMLNFTPINCQGLSRICDDQDTIDIMKEITLKHCNLIDVEPEQRLLYKIVMTTLQLHTINSSIGSNKINNEEVIKNLNSQYTDI